MGIYLNPGNEVFRRVTSADIYVDKTMMLKITNDMLDTAYNYVCMSRPRRFGKTIAGNMLSSYYSKGCDSKKIFDKLKISEDPDYLKHLNKHNVIQIDLNSEYQDAEDKKELIKNIRSDIKKELIQNFPDAGISETDSLGKCILKIYSEKHETFIFIIDEYDVLVREQVPQELFDDFLSFLNGLFKSNTLRPAISLAYITGILPVVRDKIQSKLNNFDEYTILDANRFAEYVGFTAEEVKYLCEEHSINFDECRHWYDGYSQYGYEIYNPESVVKCIKLKRFDGYWGKTSSYRVITDRLEQNFKGLKDDIIKMLSGENVDVNVSSYLNTMDSFETKDDVFTYLIHLGYLAYDMDEKTCRIPNKEIRLEWFNAIAASSDYSVTDEIIKASKDLLEKTIAGDADAAAASLDISHIHVSSNRSYTNEDVLQSAIYLSYIYALNKYTVIKEATSGKGFADVVFIPFKSGDPAMVIELKHNKSSESGL
ncbi:MAG: AAA family ATPase, partial [Lachnospiraceae bacterium]|nr:AAA family ATPase [Lachnospiraceae bacterium]